MIKQLLKQIWAQRKQNGWIFAELLVVCMLMWYIVDFCFVLLHNKSIPTGSDISDTYVVTYGVLPEENSRYDAAESDSLRMMQNLELFTRKIRQYGQVETASLLNTGWGTLPNSGGFYGGVIQYDTINTSTERKFISSGDYFRIFRYTSAMDNSWERPAGIDLYRDNAVFITRMIEKKLFGQQSGIGKKITIGRGDNSKEYMVADILNDQKRFDYDLPAPAVFIPAEPLSVGNMNSHAVCIRLKAGTPEKPFISGFKKDMTPSLRIGNLYLEDIESMTAKKANIEYEFGKTNEIRTNMIIMAFFLFCIALGVIGTFWFRIASRRNEIGVRMAMGSTRGNLQKQFILEAILLLTIAIIPAICISTFIVQADLIETLGKRIPDDIYITGRKWLRFFFTYIITYIFLAVIVGLSAWIPAYRASKIHPVEALREE
ncbi:ABC transporter permease [Proteiniphilum sp. UBA5384]|uniref:ABC transporter permease n=1 Tax=Proteiniphilum sp. UBA5384 TaxID=1947279 RepID=UPI0025FC7E4C|nr:FtsX-like permease family protein [Proteiniphilum sp. UBA5384]